MGKAFVAIVAVLAATLLAGSSTKAMNLEHLEDYTMVAAANFKGFDPSNREVEVQGRGQCQSLMDSHCRNLHGDWHAVVCSSIPEGTELRQAPGRVVKADQDGVLRQFVMFGCAPDQEVDDPDALVYMCDDQYAQAPFLCLQRMPLDTGRHHQSCRCWPRMDHNGLSKVPHEVPSLSKHFPLDKDYPTTPRVYNG